MPADPDPLRAVLLLLDRMITQQREKLMRKAKQLRPDCTFEEMMNPDGIPELARDPLFNYEDGILAGTIAAQIAIRASVLGPKLPSLHDEAPPEDADDAPIPTLGDA